MSKKYPRMSSLYMRMTFSLILGLLVALGLYFGLSALGTAYVSDVYMSSEAVAERKAEICSDFSRFVSANGVAGYDTITLQRWSSEHPYATVLVFKGLTLNQRIAGERAMAANSRNASVPEIGSMYVTQYGKLYTVNFSDGVYRIAISENYRVVEEMKVTVISVAAAFAALLLIMVNYTRRLTRRIIGLAAEAAEVGAGNLDREIRSSGRDEIAMLGTEIDNMRRSVIDRMRSEQRAWQANSNLVTAMSHDLRTPMTSMIGYLDLLESTGPEDTESIRRFASAAKRKGMELKHLTDELFRYFLIFGKTDLKLDLVRYDAPVLTEQLIGEAFSDLSAAGFEVVPEGYVENCSVDADIAYLKRVNDNLISNIRKYADPASPVTISSALEDGVVTVRFRNRISRQIGKRESTNIGLRSCARIMELLNGSFTADSDGEYFTATVCLPAAAPGVPETQEQTE